MTLGMLFLVLSLGTLICLCKVLHHTLLTVRAQLGTLSFVSLYLTAEGPVFQPSLPCTYYALNSFFKKNNKKKDVVHVPRDIVEQSTFCIFLRD